jgi:hypothetical protein
VSEEAITHSTAMDMPTPYTFRDCIACAGSLKCSNSESYLYPSASDFLGYDRSYRPPNATTSLASLALLLTHSNINPPRNSYHGQSGQNMRSEMRSYFSVPSHSRAKQNLALNSTSSSKLDDDLHFIQSSRQPSSRGLIHGF